MPGASGDPGLREPGKFPNDLACMSTCGVGVVDISPPSQGGDDGFETRTPYMAYSKDSDEDHARAAEEEERIRQRILREEAERNRKIADEEEKKKR